MGRFTSFRDKGTRGGLLSDINAMAVTPDRRCQQEPTMADDMSAPAEAAVARPAETARAKPEARRSPAKKSRLRTWRWPFAIVLIATLAAGYTWGVPLVLGVSTAVHTAKRQELVQTVVASGRVETPNRVTISSQVTGIVAKVLVSEGQAVKAGEVLVSLDDTEARTNVAQAAGAVAQASARLKQLSELALPAAREALAEAEATLDNARGAFARAEKLRKQGYLSKAAFDDAKLRMDVAKSKLRSAQLQVDSNTRSGSDFVLAETALRQSEAALQSSEARLAYLVIRAPAGGTVLSRTIETGDVVQPGKALMVLSPEGEIQLVLQIDEKNLSLIALAQPALASADAYAAEKFAAEVAYINPAVDPQRGSVEVKLRVPNPPAYLRQDMTVSVDIEVGRRKDALLIPADALRDLKSDMADVLKVNGGRAVKQTVKIGARDAGMVEILEGLAEGDQVVPGTATAIKDGQKVRVKRP